MARVQPTQAQAQGQEMEYRYRYWYRQGSEHGEMGYRYRYRQGGVEQGGEAQRVRSHWHPPSFWYVKKGVGCKPGGYVGCNKQIAQRRARVFIVFRVSLTY